MELATVVTRQDALNAGLTRGAIAHRLGPGGRWQRILPGIYLTHSGGASARERFEAALLYAGPDSMITGLSACRLHELRSAPRGIAIQVLAPHQTRRSNTGFVAIRRSRLLPRPVWMDGLAVAPVARAVIDGCRDLGNRSMIRALVTEAIQRRRTTVKYLFEELESGVRAGSLAVRETLHEVEAGVRSAAEAEAREAILGARLPDPAWNCDLVGPGGEWIARPDAYWDDAGVVLEIDSQEWHLGAQQWKDTMLRHSRMTSYGLLVIHVAPSRIRDEPEAVIAELRSTLEAGRARGGAPGVRIRRRSA
ncbi:MAG TPA: hypothetical protein VHC49_12490 [Mycobacteriales bacterium]|nr:hypothetical protein [Mycobacteriales bacterium]